MVQRTWKCRAKSLDLSETRVMGIVNVTPDSFSDGGKYIDPAKAAAHAARLAGEGADIIDFGAESTRPGHTPVTAREEQSRLLPALERYAETAGAETIVSVDTRHLSTARLVLEKSLADAVNWVGGAETEEIARIAAGAGAGLVLMRNGECGDSGFDVREIRDALKAMRSCAIAAGVREDSILVDPGIGFGTARADDVELLRNLGVFREAGGVLAGVSRKRVLRDLLRCGLDGLSAGASVGAALAAKACGAAAVRVHDVLETVQAFKVWDALYVRKEAFE